MFTILMARAKAATVRSVMEQSVTRITHTGTHRSFSAFSEGFVSTGSAVHTATEYLSCSIAATHGEGTEVPLLARPPPCTTVTVGEHCIKAGTTLV